MVEGLDTFNMTLGAVLFDAKTQTYFVPNTGQVKENGENTQKSEPQGDENTENEENMKGGEENEV